MLAFGRSGSFLQVVEFSFRAKSELFHATKDIDSSPNKGCVSTLSQSRDSEAGFEIRVFTTLILKKYWPLAGIEPTFKSNVFLGLKPTP